MGKLIQSVAAMNVNIDSMQQFPECGMDEMPALPSQHSPALSSSPAAAAGRSSFANVRWNWTFPYFTLPTLISLSFPQMLTTSKKKKSAESSWPSLSSPSTSTAAAASFFDDKKKSVQISSKVRSEKDDESPEEDDDEDEKSKSPAYHQLGDCLVSALQRQMQYGVSAKTGKKKKNKKTLLFASGLNFN